MAAHKRKPPRCSAALVRTACLCGRAKSTASHNREQVLAIRDRLLFLAERTLSDPDATRPELTGARAALLEIMRDLLSTENYRTVVILRELFERRARMDREAEDALLRRIGA